MSPARSSRWTAATASPERGFPLTLPQEREAWCEGATSHPGQVQRLWRGTRAETQRKNTAAGASSEERAARFACCAGTLRWVPALRFGVAVAGPGRGWCGRKRLFSKTLMPETIGAPSPRRGEGQGRCGRVTFQGTRRAPSPPRGEGWGEGRGETPPPYPNRCAAASLPAGARDWASTQATSTRPHSISAWIASRAAAGSRARNAVSTS
jgi:hypothetical protein